MAEQRGRRRAPRRSRWSRLTTVRARLLLSAGLLIGFGATGTFAYWADEATVTTGPITSGAMDLQFDTDGAIGLGTPYTKSAITWSGLVPGESKAFALTVKNVGKPTFAYAATVRRAASPGWTYEGTPITVRLFTGTPSTDTTYPQQETCSGTALGPSRAVSATAQGLFDQARSLPGSGAEILCLVIGIDPAATNANQSKTGAVLLDFTAEQELS